MADLFTRSFAACGESFKHARACNQCGNGPFEHDMIDLEECFELLEGVGCDD